MSGILHGFMNFIQSAFTNFSDNFNRTTTGELGTSSSGGVWKSLRGIFAANGNAARSTDLPSTYPAAIVEMTSANTTASISVGSTILVSTTGTVGSISVGDGTTGTVGFFTAVVTGMSSTTGMAAGNWISATNGTGSLYGGSPSDVEIISVDSASQITYRVKGGTQPTAGTVTNITCRTGDGGSGVALWVTDSGNWWGVTYGRSNPVSCNCSTCATYACNGFQNASTGSFCAAFTYSSAFAGNGTYSFTSGYACSGVYTYTAANACSGVYTYTSANACSGVYTYASAYAANGVYSYTSANACSGVYTSSSGYACSGVYSNVYSYRIASYSGPTYGSFCPSGYAQSGATCASYTAGAYSCATYAVNAYYRIGPSIFTVSYKCNTYSQGAATCASYTAGGYFCPSGISYSGPNYSAAYGFQLSQPCTNQNYTSYTCTWATYYTNPVGYSLYYTNPCTIQTYYTNPCTFQTYYTNPCTFQNYFTNPQGVSNYFSGPNCTGGSFTGFAPFCQLPVYGYTQCNCQTCFPGYIRLIQSSSNVVSEVTRWTLASMAAAFKVVTNAATKVITIKPYKESAMTNQIGSDLTYTATGATISTKFGVVLGPSDQAQGNTLDDFNISSN